MNRKQQGKFLLEKSYTKTAAQIGKTNLCGCKPNFMELKRKQSRLRQKRPNCPEYAGTCKQHDDACEENTAHDGENAGLKVHIEDTCGQCAGPCAGSRERDADEYLLSRASSILSAAFTMIVVKIHLCYVIYGFHILSSDPYCKSLVLIPLTLKKYFCYVAVS